MSFTTLGKRNHKVFRSSTGGWVDGEWVEHPPEEVTIRANIQPSTFSYRTQLLPQGHREKEAIAIYSNEWLHVTRSGKNPIKADVILYRGAEWEVVVSKPYGNFGQHCEALAVKIDNSITRRDEGRIGVIV